MEVEVVVVDVGALEGSWGAPEKVGLGQRARRRWRWVGRLEEVQKRLSLHLRYLAGEGCQLLHKIRIFVVDGGCWGWAFGCSFKPSDPVDEASKSWAMLFSLSRSPSSLIYESSRTLRALRGGRGAQWPGEPLRRLIG